MNGPLRLAVSCALVVLTAGSALAQPGLQPRPEPALTAESSSWYSKGEPLMYQGIVYYKAGPQIHFIQNEMVRSGFYEGVPLYTRTTIEPYSIVFVPLAGGLMQPYERRRSGEMAGTIGSSTPSFPVTLASPGSQFRAGAQAPGPPVQLTPVNTLEPAVAPPPAAVPAAPPQAVGTSGLVMPPRPAVGSTRPRASNGIFIEFDKQRWFNSGPAIAFDVTRFTRIGEYHGLPVYAERAGSPATIYIPATVGASEVVTPYTKRK